MNFLYDHTELVRRRRKVKGLESLPLTQVLYTLNHSNQMVYTWYILNSDFFIQQDYSLKYLRSTTMGF